MPQTKDEFIDKLVEEVGIRREEVGSLAGALKRAISSFNARMTTADLFTMLEQIEEENQN